MYVTVLIYYMKRINEEFCGVDPTLAVFITFI